jgi:hypothetical protein
MGDNSKICNTNCGNPYEDLELRQMKKVENKFGEQNQQTKSRKTNAQENRSFHAIKQPILSK